MVYVTIYAIKAFLPLFIISQEGGTVLWAGLFFFVQELIHFTFRPVGGRMSDRYGQSIVIVCGMIFVALGLSLVANLPVNLIFIPAMFFGVGQGLIFPSSVALLSKNSHDSYLGASMGLYGSLRNLGKVVGPIAAGGLLMLFNYSTVFYIFAGLIIIALVIMAPFWIKSRVKILN